MHEIQMLVARLHKRRQYTRDLKTLALGLCEEAGEVGKAINTFHNPEYKPSAHNQSHDLKHELCDAMVYLCSIANVAGIDLEEAMLEKLRGETDENRKEDVLDRLGLYSDRDCFDRLGHQFMPTGYELPFRSGPASGQW